MSRNDSGIITRYVDTTSPSIWPRSRPKGYQTIINSSVSTGKIDKSSLFYKWTIEGLNSCYIEINKALLNDDFQTLQKHSNYINDLRRAIRENRSMESMKLYRGLKLDSSAINQIKIGMAFLWPTFSSTSRRSNIAQGFGDYIFEIHTLPNDGTYRADISNDSAYSEEEVLFYPYSGFRVKNIFNDARIIQLECMDTLQVESLSNSPQTSASPNNTYVPTYAGASGPNVYAPTYPGASGPNTYVPTVPSSQPIRPRSFLSPDNTPLCFHTPFSRDYCAANGYPLGSHYCDLSPNSTRVCHPGSSSGRCSCDCHRN